MMNINDFKGRARAVVDHVEPAVDGGLFPVKKRAGESIKFIAHAIADGHDHLDVLLRYRVVGEKNWIEVPMHDLGNDEFSVDIRFDRVAFYEYEIVCWCDAFRNWHIGFVKKSDAADPKIGVELEIGAELTRQASKRARGEVKKRLENWALFLSDRSRDLMQKVALARESTFFETVHCHPDRSMETVSQRYQMLVERERAFFSTWYEFFPRSCANDESRHGTFKDACNRLPEIARMGFDVVYFPPIHPIGRLFRKGRNNALEAGEGDYGSPWAIGSSEGGHKSIHPELGTLDDFKDFIKASGEYGLEVAMDIAFQCAPDHPYVKEHPDWFKWRPDGTVQYAENPPKKYQDILPFDFETADWKALWNELKSVFDYWIGAGVKIFRVDNPHTKPLEFWRWCIQSIKVEHSEVLFLAEAFTRPKRKYRLAKAGFTQGYTYFTWRNTAKEMREYVEELNDTPIKDFFIPNFWPNTPDILHEDLEHGNRATFIARYILAATLSSSVGIYGPAYELLDKEAFPGKEEYNNNEKYQLKNWDWDAPGNIKEEIARINRLRHEHDAFKWNGTVRFVETDNRRLLAYLKQSPDGREKLLIVVNFDWHHAQMGHVYLPLASMGIGSDARFQVRDLNSLSLDVYTWHGMKNYVRLDPAKSPAHIFRIEP